MSEEWKERAWPVFRDAFIKASLEHKSTGDCLFEATKAALQVPGQTNQWDTFELLAKAKTL